MQHFTLIRTPLDPGSAGSSSIARMLPPLRSWIGSQVIRLSRATASRPKIRLVGCRIHDC
jgi:hypothetical protein